MAAGFSGVVWGCQDGEGGELEAWDGKDWREFEQWLVPWYFGFVKIEADSGVAAETRLSNAMSLVRWLVERSLTHLNKKVINALFSHLTQTIITPEGTLIRNAMDYIKALKMIVSYAPHLEHLSQASWECLMSICWDSAMGARIEYDKEEWTAGDLEPDVESERESEEEEIGEPSVGSLKRKFTGTMTDRRRTEPVGSGGKLTTESTELLSIVPVLLSVPNAPILPPPQLPPSDYESDAPFPRAGIRILRKTIKFLRTHPSETAAHRSVLRALTIVLGELEVNAVQTMIESAPKILALLVPLWHTKLKDQVTLALRLVVPFLSSTPFKDDADPEDQRIDREVFSQLVALRDAIARVPQGKRTQLLELPFLSLKIQPSTTKGPMQTPLICATSDFTDGMIMAWSTLELVADALALMHQHHEASSLRGTTVTSSTMTGTVSAKRQRVEEPVKELLGVMTSARHVEQRLFALQTMYFFVLRHWGVVHDRLRVGIREVLQGLMSDPVAEVQQWADLGLAIICHVDDTAVKEPPPTTQKKDGKGQDWLEIWHLALRKLIVTAGASSRSAALLLQVILKKQILEPVLIITSLGKFLESVNDQGPATPYDAVCDFMVDCLDAADRDARLHRMGLGAKVSEWFRTAWLAQKTVAEAGDRANFEIGSAARLICRLVALPGFKIGGEGQPLTSSPLFVRMEKEEHVVDIREFMLHAKLPSSASDRDSADSPTEETARPFASSDARALSRLFGQKLQQLDLVDADSTNVARLRSKLDSCILILLIESGFIDSDPEHSHANFETACDLLEKMLQLSFQKNWTLAERARIFAGLDAMFPHASSTAGKSEGLLCKPGYASGILSVIKANAEPKRDAQADTGIQASAFHVNLWQKEKVSLPFAPPALADCMPALRHVSISSARFPKHTGRRRASRQ